MEDLVVEGVRLVGWKNKSQSQNTLALTPDDHMKTSTPCQFSKENIDKLLHILPTPSCGVSSFIIAWRKLNDQHDSGDILLPCLKTDMLFVNHHLDMRFSNKRVVAAYSMKSLYDAVMSDDEMSICRIVDRQLCQHAVYDEGTCKKKTIKSRAPTKLACVQGVYLFSPPQFERQIRHLPSNLFRRVLSKRY